jgi:hypothetical protein
MASSPVMFIRPATKTTGDICHKLKVGNVRGFAWESSLLPSLGFRVQLLMRFFSTMTVMTEEHNASINNVRAFRAGHGLFERCPASFGKELYGHLQFSGRDTADRSLRQRHNQRQKWTTRRTGLGTRRDTDVLVHPVSALDWELADPGRRL